MATTATAFKLRFPEFTDVVDGRVNIFIADAALLMGSEERWIKYFDVAQEYYAAHLLACANATEAGDTSPLQAIAHQEVDDVVIKNAVADATATMDDIYSTSYGKRFAHYRKMCFAGGLMI